MGEALSDQDRELETMKQLEHIAASIFARYGVDFATARRAGGWSNATWIAGGLALRLSVRQGNENIRRDVQLAALLPREVGYPTTVESGVTDGYEWALSKEIPGRCLGEVWPDLDWDERINALRQLWEKAQAVHSIDVAAASSLARKRAWYNSTDAEEAEASLLRLMQQRLFTSRQADILAEALGCFWKTLPAATCLLNHGDLTLDNAIWHQGQVVSLLDFEFAVMAPVELDLNMLVKSAFGPVDEKELLSEADLTGRLRMRQAVADLAKPILALPGSKDLLFGYATLLDLWLLEVWLAHPEGEGPLEQWDPYRRLLSLAGGQLGYLAPLFSDTQPRP